jgi:hypothetical protein
MQTTTHISQSDFMLAQLVKAFHTITTQYQFKPIERSVYSYLINVFTSLGCQQQFWHCDLATALGAGCSLNTMKKARARLVQIGLIHHTAGGYGHAQKTMYTINTAFLQTTTPVIPFSENAYGETDSYQNLTPTTQSSYQHLTPLVNSSPLNKKNGGGSAPPVCMPVSTTQEPMFAAPPPPPTHDQIERKLQSLAETDFGRELVPGDLDVLRKIEAKWLAACEQRNWTYSDGTSIAAKWEASLSGYFASCVDDVRASREKLRMAEMCAQNTAKNQEQRSEYYAERRVEKAKHFAEREAAHKHERAEWKQERSSHFTQSTNGKIYENAGTSAGKNGGGYSTTAGKSGGITVQSVFNSACNNSRLKHRYTNVAATHDLDPRRAIEADYAVA